MCSAKQASDVFLFIHDVEAKGTPGSARAEVKSVHKKEDQAALKQHLTGGGTSCGHFGFVLGGAMRRHPADILSTKSGRTVFL